MREIVLDTETTGLDPYDTPSHRIVEIGAVELWNQVPTGNTYHQYINPGRDMPAEAFAVHGISEQFLTDKPPFPEIADAFLAFVADSRMIIHNASFDMKFLNAELKWASRPALPSEQALDTLMIARRKFPGSPGSLDALCRRFGIDNSNRTLHGALLDSEILAEVYLELTGGRQTGLALDTAKQTTTVSEMDATWRPGARPAPLPNRVSEEELNAHQTFVAEMGEGAIWLKSTR